jgi:site-specific recombinase XerD
MSIPLNSAPSVGGLGERRPAPPAVPQTLPALQAPRLLDQLRERIRLLHYSRSTEDAYVHRCKAFIRFHGRQHPKDLGGPEVEAFLTWLADERQLAPASHKQALSALLFLYIKVLGIHLPWMQEIGRPRVKKRLPVVLSCDEVSAVLHHLDGVRGLFAQLLYGTGLRLTEGLQLQVKDVDFAHRAIVVREDKGGKDRIVMRPQALATGLRAQL